MEQRVKEEGEIVITQEARLKMGWRKGKSFCHSLEHFVSLDGQFKNNLGVIAYASYEERREAIEQI